MSAKIPDGFWFWVWLTQITIKKADLRSTSPRGEVWRNLNIVQAASAREAIRKAMIIRKSEEGDSRGSLTLDGEPAITKFLGIEDIGFIHDGLSDGSEILFRSERMSLEKCKRAIKQNRILQSRLAKELAPKLGLAKALRTRRTNEAC